MKGWNDDRWEKKKEVEGGRRKEGERRRKEGERRDCISTHIHTNIHRLLQVGLLAHSPIVICLFYVLYFMMFYKTSIEVKTRVVVIFFSFKCLNHHLCSDFAYTIMVHAPHPSSSGDPHLFIQLQAHVSFLLCIPVICVNLCCDCSSLFFNYLTFPNRLFLFFGTPVTAVRTMPSFHSFVADMVHHNRYF